MTARLYTTVYADNDLPTTEAEIVSKSLGTVDAWTELEYTVHEHGTGLFKGRINRHHAQAALLQQDRYLLVHSDAGVVGGALLEEAPIDLSAAEGPGDEWMSWGGRGQVAILARGAMDATSNLSGGQAPIEGYWDLDSQGDFAGASNAHPIPMLKRALVEMLLNSPSGIDVVDHSGFDYDTDSASVAVPFLDGEAQGANVGDDGLTLLARMDQLGGVTFVMSPLFKLDAYLTHGTDRAGAFGVATVRFEKGVNVAAAIQRKVRGSVHVTHLIVGGAEFAYRTVIDPDWVAGDVVRWGFLAVPEASDPDQLDAAGLAHIARRKRQTDAWQLPLHDHGDDPANGIYEPAPDIADGHFWLGDTVSHHTGSGTYDANEEESPIASITWRLKTGDEANGDYQVSVGIGSTFNWSASSAFEGTAPGSQHRLRLCDPDIRTIETDTSWIAFDLGTAPDDWNEAVPVDESAWTAAVEGFGEPAGLPMIGRSNTDKIPSEEVLLRRAFWIEADQLSGADVAFEYAIDNGGEIYVNGTLVATLGTRYVHDAGHYTSDHATTLSRSLFHEGYNVVAIRAWNQGDGSVGATPPGQVSAALTIAITAEWNLSGTEPRASRCGHHHPEYLTRAQHDLLTHDVGDALDPYRHHSHGQFLYVVHRDSNDQLYLLGSDDGVTFEDVGGGILFTPDVADNEATDGSIIHYDGWWWITFSGFTLGTAAFTVYKSRTLEAGSWTKVIEVDCSSITSGSVWAPEWFIDPVTGDVHVYVAIDPTGGAPGPFNMYEAHPTNRAMTAWSAPVQVTGTGWPASIIDGFMVYAPEIGTPGKPYKLWWKRDDAAFTIGYSESDQLTSGFTAVETGDWAGWGGNNEAPCLVRLDDGRWRIYFNQHSGFDSVAVWYSESTDGWATWSAKALVTTPWLAAHGTVVRLRGMLDHEQDAEAHKALFEAIADAPEALDDLSDVTIADVATGDMLRFDGSSFVNTPGRWEPVVTDPGTGPELVFTATDIVMAWVDS